MSERPDDAAGRARLVSMIDHLVNGLAHELNNVLTPIASGLDGADRPLDDLRGAVERGTRLAAGLQLVCARGASVGPVELGAFVADFLPALKRLVTSELWVDAASGGEPTFVHLDAWVLEQVLWRVVQASEQGGQRPMITISTERHAAPLDDGARARCPVLARGERCHAIRVRTSSPPSGRGDAQLGFASALAARVGAVVSPADRWPDDGTVLIHLPIVASDGIAAGSALESADVDVIVVEDDHDLRSLMRRLLQREGHVVAEAHGASDALVQLDSNPTARLMLADLSLGGRLNGMELLRRATGARPDLGVLLVSGHVVPDAPAVPFLRKPFTPRMFIAKIRELLPPSTRRADAVSDPRHEPAPGES